MKTHEQIPQRDKFFPIIEEEDLIDTIKLAGPLNANKVKIVNKKFVLKDQIDNLPLSCQEIEKKACHEQSFL